MNPSELKTRISALGEAGDPYFLNYSGGTGAIFVV